MNIFREHDVHYVYKIGIKCFGDQDAEMSLNR